METEEMQLVARLAGLRVLVIGDVTLDEYLFGRPTRLSREAPVPVLELARREVILGGAANPARNIAALGSHAIQVGVVGDDGEAEQLREAFRRDGIAPDGLIRVAARPTTIKTRILAYEAPRLPQQVARLDRLDRSPLPAAIEQHIVAVLQQHIPYVDAVLCSDYQMGLLSPGVVDTIHALCKQHAVLLTVDAQGNAAYYRGVDLFRCNDREAAATLGIVLHSEADFQTGLATLQDQLQVRLIIVTRGPDGLSMRDQQGKYIHLPAVNASEVYDTTGAGDTFIAVVTLGLAAGLEPLLAAQLANTAAALVVRKLGNAVVPPAELAQAMQRHTYGG